MNLGPSELLVLVVIAALAVIPFWRILGKAGFHPALSLIVLVPVGVVVLVLVLAFVPWPIHRDSE